MTSEPRRAERDRPRDHAQATVRRALDRARRDGALLAVLLLDAGDVGRVDRAFGHGAGDQALAELERRVREALPPACRLTALTRERLVVVAERLPARGDALALAGAIAALAREPLSAADVRVRLDATVGIALAEEGHGAAADLLRDADAAARRAHGAGEQPLRLADPAEHERAERRLRLEDELAEALAREQLVLYFQPIVSLRRGTLVGVEALVRWQHPARGLIGPAQFLPVAEESGLIVEIGDWMLQAVCHQLARWSAQPQPLPPVALNVSGRELLEQAFASRFATTVHGAQVPPETIVLEIADPASLHRREDLDEVLATLRRLGVRIVLDRFGGAQSTLAQLAQLPIDGLKLDRSLLPATGAGSGELPIAEAVVGLAHTLGLSITVPGVETERELETVRALRADAAQGHLIARPAPAAALLDLHDLELGLARPRGRTSEEQATDADELLPLSAVAQALGVSASTARRLADQGVLPGTRTEGGHRRFRRGDVQRLARERSRAPRLRRWELPEQPLPLSAQLLERDGQALAERAARAIYEPARTGWFAAPQGAARARAWLDALGPTLAAGTPSEALAATAAYGDAAALGGASVPEVARFLGQFGALASHELVRAHGAADEGRALQRVMSAATEAFLAKL